MKRILIFLLVFLTAVGLTGCGGAETGTSEEASGQVFAMDTVMSFTAYGGDGEGAVQQAQEVVSQMEELLSRTREDSQVSRLNAADGQQMAVDPALGKLIQAAGAYRALTGGSFDITIAPVADAWGFTKDVQQVPDSQTLAERLALVDGSQVQVTERDDTWYVRLGQGQSVDLGGIAKGYVSDLLEGAYAEHGVSSGVVYLGGNVYVRGAKTDGTAWRVGVQDPHAPEDGSAYAAILLLQDAFAVTSGGYQRNFEMDGQLYRHILDPATGRPAQSGLLSVTVVADATGRTQLEDDPGNGTMCDALSTALFVLGEERALDLWRAEKEAFDLVLVTEDGRVVLTEGLADRYEAIEGSGYTYEIVS